MSTNPATISKKSATSTEVWYAQVRGLDETTGGLTNPTSGTLSAAVLEHPTEAGDTRSPADADYTTTGVAWLTLPGPRYMAKVLLGPLATLNPAGPSSEQAERTWEVWLRIAIGSESVRFKAGLLGVTP